ncbi:MAG: peptide-methionine (S)-S-oxide reductase MsrA [Gemmatimonadaceae bacterium]
MRTVPVLLLAVSGLTIRSPERQATDSVVVLAGGCFWGVEAVFEHLRGVRSVTSGYASYGSPNEDHSPVPIEAVRITYDPKAITHRQLLEVFFSIAHDPTSRDRQGPDAGPEYRAVVFHASDDEQKDSEAYREELSRLRRFARPIVTEVRRLAAFQIAEPFHQDYASRHPHDPYIVYNDAPKLVRLKQQFPALYQEQRAP